GGASRGGAAGRPHRLEGSLGTPASAAPGGDCGRGDRARDRSTGYRAGRAHSVVAARGNAGGRDMTKFAPASIETPAAAPRILLVDDTPANLSLLVDALHGSGYRPLIANSGEAAMVRLRRNQPDLILLDMRMPGMDGMQTMAGIQKSDTGREIPVIFMTAVEEPEQKVAALEAGAVDYVTKPFDTREVLARIETHLRLKALQQSLAEELAWREETERVLQACLEQAVVVAGRDGQVQFATDRAVRLLGRYFGEPAGKPDMVALPARLAELVRQGRSTRLCQAGATGELEVRIVTDPSSEAPVTVLLDERRAP